MLSNATFETTLLMNNLGEDLFQLSVINRSQAEAVETCFDRGQYRDVIRWLRDLFKVKVMFKSSRKLVSGDNVNRDTNVTLAIPLDKLKRDDEHRIVRDTSKVLKSKQSFKSIW